MGIVAGHRAMTPMAALAGAARRGNLPYDNGEARFLAAPFVTIGSVILATGEMVGDKMANGPDRTAPFGLLGRIISGGFAGATLAPRGRQVPGAGIAIGAAAAAAYGGLAARRWAMRRWGRTATGFLEDILTLTAANLIAGAKVGDTVVDHCLGSRRRRHDKN